LLAPRGELKDLIHGSLSPYVCVIGLGARTP
jgi:hypothetical protein